MKIKIILFLFILIMLIGITLSAGETTSKTVAVGVTEEILKDVTASGVDLNKGNDGSTLTFLEGGSADIKGALFNNVEKSSSIKLDNNEEIISADLTATSDTSFNFKKIGETYALSKGSRLIYENGKVTVEKEGGKDSFGLKQEVLDESGNDIGRSVNIKMNGDSINIEKNTEGNTIFTGNFDMGDNKVSGIGTNAGRITVSNKDGRISEIWKGTDVTMKNVDFNVVGGNLNMYYDENFVASAHSNENYFNYAKDKISAGGTGFTSDLTKSTNIFGDMKTTKEVTGIGTKTRDLDITLNGGTLDISKDTSSKDDLAFNVNGNGDYIIDDGRSVIYSQKKPVKAGESSNEYEILVKTDCGDGSSYGLSSSYNINLNNDQYILKDNLFEDKNGDVLVNANTPWENVAYIAGNIDSNEANNIRTEMEKEDKLIYVDDPNFLTWIKGEDGEAIMKEVYTSADTANQNKYGVEISPLELYGAMKSEGWGFKADSSSLPPFESFIEQPDKGGYGGEFGLTYSVNTQVSESLKDGGFIPEDIELIKGTNSFFSQDQLKVKDAFTYFAGVLAQKKYFFQKDFKALYGEDEYNSLTSDEESYWTTYYFNAGEGAGKNALKNREENYVTVWEGGRPSDTSEFYGNAQFNSRLRTDFEEYLNALGLFNYP
jgi:hypothetical protein